MRESRPYGSVRGALSNERSYRDTSTRPANRSATTLAPCFEHVERNSLTFLHPNLRQFLQFFCV